MKSWRSMRRRQRQGKTRSMWEEQGSIRQCWLSYLLGDARTTTTMSRKTCKKVVEHMESSSWKPCWTYYIAWFACLIWRKSSIIWSQATEGSAMAMNHASWVLQAANPTQPMQTLWECIWSHSWCPFDSILGLRSCESWGGYCKARACEGQCYLEARQVRETLDAIWHNFTL